METAAGGPVEVTLSHDTGLVTFLSMDAHGPVPVAGAAATSPEEIARTFIGDYAGAFGFRSAASELELHGPAWQDALGQEHVRFRQVVRGVPVTAGEITVHLRGSDVIAVNAETLPDLEGFDTTPEFFADQVLNTVRNLVASTRIGVPDAELSSPRLEILNRGLLEGGRQPSRLAWFVEARGPALREYIWIDAKRGRVLLHFSQLPHALNRQVYDLNSTSFLPGTLVRGEGGPPTALADADLAYQYSGDTYNYFLSQHGRDSYDGAGAPIISSVRYCRGGSCPYLNAFWNGNQMVYGAGFPAADDVDAHELTHAVTERSADLLYYMQSGALNESFSDIFGETVDLTNGGGTDTPAVRWKMGEDVPGFGAIRDMSNPNTFNDPAKVSDAKYYCGTGDNGGVHHNSGVQNHFYALLVDGGTYNGQTVTGLGLTKAGKIAYRALTTHLLSGSGFPEAASAFRRSCADLAGTAGITVADCQEVEDALAAVEMTATPPCPLAAGPIPPLCPAGQSPANAFFDNFEAGYANTNWLVSYVAFEPAWFYAVFGFTTSGKWHLSGYNWDVYEDSSAFMKNSVPVPSNARMQFNHFWDFDPPARDGGVVEYSLNGGTSWVDASPLFSAGANYPSTVSTADNPLFGRPAFVGTSRRYTGTQYDLSTLAGQSVKFRFRIGTSEDYWGWWGWDVDDVRIYTCAACTYTLTYNQGFVGAGGGSGTAEITTQEGCTWTASSDAAWLTVTPALPGSGKVGYTAQPNPTGTPRSAILTLGGQTFTVYQGGEADFYTLEPCRLFDTRAGTAMTSGAIRVFDVAGLCGIPSTAKAVSINLTTVSPTSLGYISLFPGGVAGTLASSINFPAGTTRANNAIVTLSPDGAGKIQGLAVMVGVGTVHLVVDVNGYFE
jgi:Zn-dependent metalloprotease